MTTQQKCCPECAGFSEKPGSTFPPCANVMDCPCHGEQGSGWENTVIAAALESGFMLSTLYGQQEPKAMPASDTETLLRFADKIRTSQKAALVERVRKMKHVTAAFSSARLIEKQQRNMLIDDIIKVVEDA